MKMIHYMSDNKRMTGSIKEQSNGVWSMYRGLIGGAMAYCGDMKASIMQCTKWSRMAGKKLKEIFEKYLTTSHRCANI